MASNRKCVCCGEKYSYCPTCGRDRLKEAWYSTFCSETCKDLWQVLSEYSMGMLEKADAADKIKALSLKDKSQYEACVQRDMNKILSEEFKIKRNKKVEPIIEDTKSHAVVLTEKK